MVTTQRLVLRSQLRTTAVTELLGMQLDWQAQALGRSKHPPDLRSAKCNALAKAIDRINQPFSVQDRQHLQHGIHIVIRAPGEFARHSMGPQEGGAYIHRMRLAQGAGHLQALAFVFQRQPVAGFDLDGGHALVQQFAKALGADYLQLLCAGVAGGLDGGCYAATGAGNLLVAGTVQALFELLRPIAAVDQVRVTVDEAWGNQRTARIVLHIATRQQFGRQRSVRTNPRQGVAVHHQSGVLDQAVRSIRLRRHRGDAAVCP